MIIEQQHDEHGDETDDIGDKLNDDVAGQHELAVIDGTLDHDDADDSKNSRKNQQNPVNIFDKVL